MVSYTNQQRFQIIKAYYQNFESVAATLRALTPIFGRYNRPTRAAILSLVHKFESTFSLHNVPVPVRQRLGRSAENIAAVSASVQNDPNQSIPRRSQELGIAQTTLWRFFGVSCVEWILVTCGSSRMELQPIQLMQPSTF